jgi:hypothetical protein
MASAWARATPCLGPAASQGRGDAATFKQRNREIAPPHQLLLSLLRRRQPPTRRCLGALVPSLPGVTDVFAYRLTLLQGLLKL